MFAGDGSIGHKFQEFSRIDVSSEFSFFNWFKLILVHQITLDRQEDVLICDKCSTEVKKTFDLRESIRDFDELYFEPKRQEENENIEGSVNEIGQGRPKGLCVTAKKNYKNINSGSESKCQPMKKTVRNAHRFMPDLELQDNAQQKNFVKAKQEFASEDKNGSGKNFL